MFRVFLFLHRLQCQMMHMDQQKIGAFMAACRKRKKLTQRQLAEALGVTDLGSLRSPAGKKPFIAHFAGGARNVARNEVGQLPPALGARSCSPFSAVKMGGPFSLRCLSPLCSPRRRRWADSNGGAWDSLVLRGWTRCFHGQTCFPIRGWCKPYSNYASWTLRCNLDIFARQKASVNLESRWPF